MNISPDFWNWLVNQGPAFVILGLGLWALLKPKPLLVPGAMYEEVKAERDRALKLLDKSTEVMQETLEKMGDLLSVLKPLDKPLPPSGRHRSTKEGP